MTEPSSRPENLKSFDADVDENGQNMSDAPNDRARPKDLQRALASDPGGEAETARIASGHPGDGADEATAAEIPAEVNRHLGDASSTPSKDAASDAIDRATSGLGRK